MSKSTSVLFVGTEPSVVAQSGRAFDDAGFSLHAARTTLEALQVIAYYHPVVVFIDASTLRHAGRELLSSLRVSYPDVASIVLTSVVDPAATADAYQLGAFECMPLPRRLEELVPVCKLTARTFELQAKYASLRDVMSEKTLGISDQLSLRPDRAALECAAWARLTTVIGEAITNASTPVLQFALSQPASTATLTCVLKEALVGPTGEGDWAAALLRGAEVQRDLLRQAGGTLSASKVGELLGITRAAVDKRRRQGALLGIKLPSGDIAYPAAQFRNGDAVAGLSEVLRSFRVRDPWMQLETLLASDEAFDGRSGFDALASGDVERVKAVASAFGEQGL